MGDTSALIERLREHQLLTGLPDAELEWLAANGELRKESA